jgi:hypothetical protein
VEQPLYLPLNRETRPPGQRTSTTRSVRSFEYCLMCHSTEKQEGELDLQRFTSVEQVKQHPDVW